MIVVPSAFVETEKVRRFRLSRGPRNNGPLRIFAGGNIEGRKGVSLAIRALAKVAEAGHDFHYTVAGGGPEIGKLRDLVGGLGLGERVEFHPGYQGDDYVRQLQSSDVYLLPSFRETTPVTLQEALLAGCYPIVADASAAGEMVRMAGGDAVRADSPEDMVEALAKAIVAVAGDRERMQRVGSEASRRVADYFSAERYGDLTEEAYRIAISAKRHT